VAVVAPEGPTERNDLRDIYVRTQSNEDGVGDAAVHGEFDVRSDSYATSDKRSFDASKDLADPTRIAYNAKLHYDLLAILQDIESSRSYIDELYSPDAQKCLEAIM